ncbi:FAD-binding oxidoreductase [Halapricum hydrolyticum]|uniref:FAD-binding oxidoreductase n=1 Tax=Halapricum hydrolyticum TaxID=2979991 RepID=A0AAE3LG33_9EURY|nr:FAD-binding oxidoreductase [Halapricum hydrolyticum]MCU4719644.1 FAD-binding oxidoreductase [Halapricum hydrolyticum]MCU4728566.1 FAD-binding oxidoreductase [Halapricum hydrolyticum]
MSLETQPTTDESITEFAGTLRGTLLRPDDEGYDEARSVWNGMIDKYPALVVQCAGTSDVINAVTFAKEQDLPISVKSGGHNIAGRAVEDDALMIDLSPMKSVRVDPDAKTARVEPGVVLGELDHETQQFGLATPAGYNSQTGIAGLTLGGGWGWLSRKHGLTVDNLLSADVVTAQGELVHASEDENEDLFWGLRGGGGNFGIVTSFEFQLHEVGPTVLSGPIVHPFDDAETVLEGVREFTADAPNDATVWTVIRHAPPFPFLPEEWHGRKVVILATFYAGDMEEGEDALLPLRDIGDPIADAIGPNRYTDWQQAFDGLAPAGARHYWKSHNFDEMTDEMIETFIEYGKTIPTRDTMIEIPHLGGAMNDKPVDATAYPHREFQFTMNLHTMWTDPEQDGECISWAREMHEAMAPHATGGVYANFVPEADGDQQAAYGENYERLVQIKNEWDPENLFRLNHNVEPTE